MPPDNEGERPSEASTWLVIPYFAGDFGRPNIERPIDPNKAVYYLSPAVVIDGTPGKTSFVRGQNTSITVEVANWGAGSITAPVQVRVWWADPTLAFTHATPFGQTVLLAPPGVGPVRSPEIIGQIPLTAPAHVCLLVHVAAPKDGSPAGSVPDPAGDRHWAQLNLTETVTSAEGAFKVLVNAGNPFDRELVVRLSVNALSEAELALLARRLEREIRTTEAAAIEMRVAGRQTDGEVTLRPGEQLPLEVSGTVRGLTRGSTVALVVKQSGTSVGSERPFEGAVGVLVTFPGE